MNNYLQPNRNNQRTNVTFNNNPRSLTNINETMVLLVAILLIKLLIIIM